MSAAPAALGAGPSVTLVLTPSQSSITAGESQTYSATAYQTNSRGTYGTDVTGHTTFTITPDGSCAPDTTTPGTTTPGTETCTATTAGAHTVTGTITYQVGYTTGTATATATATATLTVTPGPAASLALDPGSATITAGTGQSYHAIGKDAYSNSFDVTGDTTFTITPDGSCAPDTTTPGTETCTATAAGTHTVTGTYSPGGGVTAIPEGGTTGPLTATATLTVTPGPAASLALDPGSATIPAGTGQAYHATGKDAYGNSFDVTGDTTFTITPDGSCAPDTTTPGTETCTATAAGTHTVTGTYSPGGGVTVTGTATLTVTPGPPVSLALAPGSASIAAGSNSPAYQATGKDTYGNFFDATSSTSFTIAGGTCTTDPPKTCTATAAGPHTVTGTIDRGDGVTVTGTATLTVTPGPAASLTLDPGSATIPAGDSQAYHATGKDTYGNSFDATSSTSFTIANGTCTTDQTKTCTATIAGLHTVTGTIDRGDGVTVTGTATLTVKPGPLASLTLHPRQATIIAGQQLAYRADGEDAYGNPLGDLTGATTFTIAPDGSCTTNTCTATAAGAHTVTGAVQLGRGVTVRGTATLRVKPGPLATLALTPRPGTITAGRDITYHAGGEDAYGNSLGSLTSSTTFTIAPDGSCTVNTCTATTAGQHTVTGTITLRDGGTARGTATLTVQPGPPATLSLHPRQATITAGQSRAYQDDGQDAYGNSLGDLTSSTIFTITDGTCTTSTCTASTAGTHTVTGTIHLREHVVTGTATLQVQREIAPGGPGSSPPLPSPSSDSSPPSPAPSSSSSAGPVPPAPSGGNSPPAPVPSSFSNTGSPPPTAPGGPATSPNCRPAARQLRGLRVAPRAASPGTSVRVTARLGRNFAGCPLAVLLGGSHVGDTTVRRDGSVSDRSAVPDTAKSGATTLALARTDGGVLARTAFEVVPGPSSFLPWPLAAVLGLLLAGGALLLRGLGGRALASQRDRRQRRWVRKHVRVEPDPAPGHISAALDPHTPPPLTVRLAPQDQAGTIGISKETGR